MGASGTLWLIGERRLTGEVKNLYDMERTPAAMIWFGMSNQTAVFTVVVTSFPMVFVAALQDTRSLDNHLTELAQSFRLPWLMKLTDFYFRTYFYTYFRRDLLH